MGLALKRKVGQGIVLRVPAGAAREIVVMLQRSTDGKRVMVVHAAREVQVDRLECCEGAGAKGTAPVHREPTPTPAPPPPWA